MGKVKPRKYPNWIKAYMEYTKASEAPDKFHFWTAVSTVAGALRRNVWIDMGYFQWYPNFYIIFIGDPGIVKKSSTMDIGHRLLKAVEGIYFGPSSTTWQALIDSLQEAQTVTEMADGVFIPSCPMTLGISELGTFLNTKDSQMIDHLVHLWDGKTEDFQKRTRKDGKQSVPNPWINFIGATTKSWFSQNFPEYMVGGGFMSRTVFVYADAKRRYVAYPKDEMNEEMIELQTNLVHDLELMTGLIGEYKLTKEAKEWGTEWYENLGKNPPKHLTDTRLLGYKDRKQGHVHKLAMVLTAAKSDELIIHADTLQQAESFLSAVESEYPSLFGNIGQSIDGKLTNDILDFIRVKVKATNSEIFQNFMLRANKHQIMNAIAAIHAAGRIKPIQEGAIVYYRYASA